MLKNRRVKFSTCQDLILVEGAYCVVASYCLTWEPQVRISIQATTTGPCCEFPRSETCRNISMVRRRNTASSDRDAPVVREKFCNFSLVLSRSVSKCWRTSLSTSDVTYFLVGFRRWRQPLPMPLGVLTGHWFNGDLEGNVSRNESPASHPQHLCSSSLSLPSESWQWPHLTCGSWGWWKQRKSPLRGKNILETVQLLLWSLTSKALCTLHFCFQ